MRTMLACLYAAFALLSAPTCNADARSVLVAEVLSNEPLMEILRPIALGEALLHDVRKSSARFTATIFRIVGVPLRVHCPCRRPAGEPR